MGIVKWLSINVTCLLLLNADLLKTQAPVGYDLVWADEFDEGASLPKLQGAMDTMRSALKLTVAMAGIAKKPDAAASGTVYFDYLRCYEISPENYALRKTMFIKY